MRVRIILTLCAVYACCCTVTARADESAQIRLRADPDGISSFLRYQTSTVAPYAVGGGDEAGMARVDIELRHVLPHHPHVLSSPTGTENGVRLMPEVFLALRQGPILLAWGSIVPDPAYRFMQQPLRPGSAQRVADPRAASGTSYGPDAPRRRLALLQLQPHHGRGRPADAAQGLGVPLRMSFWAEAGGDSLRGISPPSARASRNGAAIGAVLARAREHSGFSLFGQAARYDPRPDEVWQPDHPAYSGGMLLQLGMATLTRLRSGSAEFPGAPLDVYSRALTSVSTGLPGGVLVVGGLQAGAHRLELSVDNGLLRDADGDPPGHAPAYRGALQLQLHSERALDLPVQLETGLQLGAERTGSDASHRLDLNMQLAGHYQDWAIDLGLRHEGLREVPDGTLVDAMRFTARGRLAGEMPGLAWHPRLQLRAATELEDAPGFASFGTADTTEAASPWEVTKYLWRLGVVARLNAGQGHRGYVRRIRLGLGAESRHRLRDPSSGVLSADLSLSVRAGRSTARLSASWQWEEVCSTQHSCVWEEDRAELSVELLLELPGSSGQ